MSITGRLFGKEQVDQQIKIYTLKNSVGMQAEITNYGGSIVSLFVPDKDGSLADVVLGFDNVDDYVKKRTFFGSIVGRHANRIENSKFTLNGEEYYLAQNDGKNHLHGGITGFDKVVWQGRIVKNGRDDALELSYTSVDGEENYPGNLDVKVTYTLTEQNEIKIDYHAKSDKDTIVNLTNHSFFNLAGHESGDVLDHLLMINADKFTPVDKEGIPTGEVESVDGTPMDFRSLTSIGSKLNTDYEQIKIRNGYDHNWILKNSGSIKVKAAEVYDPKSGRGMEVYTTKPGIQFYSGNYLDGSDIGKGGIVYNNRNALCLETQYFPNAMKHKHFPSPILKAGEEYKHTTIYKFVSREL